MKIVVIYYSSSVAPRVFHPAFAKALRVLGEADTGE